MSDIVVLAKAPVAGRVKTRLTPHFTPQQAADLAEAALSDTLAVARSCARVTLALEGEPGAWLPGSQPVLPQRGDGLAERIAHAMRDAWVPGTPILLIGMDTPQVTAALLDEAAALLATHDAVLGLADDGGWWALGLREPDERLLHDVPMSAADTGEVQLKRLREAGLSVAMLPSLRDVDTPADAALVASLAPASRFARVHADLAALVAS